MVSASPLSSAPLLYSTSLDSSDFAGFFSYFAMPPFNSTHATLRDSHLGEPLVAVTCGSSQATHMGILPKKISLGSTPCSWASPITISWPSQKYFLSRLDIFQGQGQLPQLRKPENQPPFPCVASHGTFTRHPTHTSKSVSRCRDDERVGRRV